MNEEALLAAHRTLIHDIQFVHIYFYDIFWGEGVRRGIESTGRLSFRHSRGVHRGNSRSPTQGPRSPHSRLGEWRGLRGPGHGQGAGRAATQPPACHSASRKRFRASVTDRELTLEWRRALWAEPRTTFTLLASIFTFEVFKSTSVWGAHSILQRGVYYIHSNVAHVHFL